MAIETVINQEVIHTHQDFFDSVLKEYNIDNLMNTVLNYECFKVNCPDSYLKGLSCVSKPLIEMYKEVGSLFLFGGTAISMLEKTINENVLNKFVNTYIAKEDGLGNKLKIDGNFNIPKVCNKIEDLNKNNICELDRESYIMGIKRIVHLLHYAFNHKRTKPFKGLIGKYTSELIKCVKKNIQADII